MKLGFIGLGKMGSRMALKLLAEGNELIVWNRSSTPVEELRTQNANLKSATKNLKASETIQELVQDLHKPRIIWLMLPAGEATQSVLDEVSKYAEKDDVVIDGGNAYYKDTEKRFQDFKKNNIRFLGIGVSGGIIAAEKGYPLMVGGDKSAYDHIRSVLDSLAKPNGGHEYFGEGGVGHFIKMVHNGIEYGYMQALGEGFGVLNSSQYSCDLLKVAKLYQKGTLISGFMIDRTVDALEKDPMMGHIQGIIAESGEARWTVEEAQRQHVPIEIIQKSLEFRKKSQTEKSIQESFAAKLVAALRQEFGGHLVKKK